MRCLVMEEGREVGREGTFYRQAQDGGRRVGDGKREVNNQVKCWLLIDEERERRRERGNGVDTDDHI